MNEVENMYENAGIKSKAECTSKVCIVTNPHKDWCNKCESLKYDIPPFTAEKQLELIKWMIKTNHRYFIQDIVADDFSKTLAGVFNLYWQDLTEEERKQIKEILE